MSYVAHLAILGVCGICTVELLIYFNLLKTVNKLNQFYRKVAYVIRNKRISDRWKERVLPRYACRTFSMTSVLLVHFVIIFSPIILASALYSRYNLQIYYFILSWTGMFYVTIVVSVYALLRKKYVKR